MHLYEQKVKEVYSWECARHVCMLGGKHENIYLTKKLFKITTKNRTFKIVFSDKNSQFFLLFLNFFSVTMVWKFSNV